MRGYLRTPGLALALLFTIALGIGSTVAVQGFARGLTAHTYADPVIDGVVSVFGQDPQSGPGPISWDDYASIRRGDAGFAWLGAARMTQRTVRLNSQTQILSVAAVTPALARHFQLSVNHGLVISHRLWRRELHSERPAADARILVDGVPVRVDGVAAEWLEGVYRDQPVDLWMAMPEDGPPEAAHSSRNLWVLAGLAGNGPTSQAQTTLATQRGSRGGLELRAYTGQSPAAAEGDARIGLLLNSAATAVFFIACVNVASFLLGRATSRSQETSLRVALGASRGQLGQQLLSDSIVISATGGALGLLLAVWTQRMLPALLFEQDAEALVFAPDLLRIGAASATYVGVTIACGLLPVVATSHDRPWTVLRSEGSGPSRGMRGLRAGLAVAEMAICFLLVIATAFLFDGLQAALKTSVGRSLGQAVLATMEARPEAGLTYFRNAEAAALSTTGATQAAWAGRLPGSLPTWRSFRIEPRQLPLRDVTMDMVDFDPKSTRLFQSPPVAGRLFGYEDQTCPAAVVNEEAAALLSGQSTVGRVVEDPARRPVVVIGVVRRRRTQPARPTVYFLENGASNSDTRVPAQRFRAPEASPLATAELDANVVSRNYFDTMGFSLTNGRSFADGPGARGCRTGIVNQEAADRYFGGMAVGAALIDDSGRRTTITGVVRGPALGTYQRRVEPAIYFPMEQDCLPVMTLILGTRSASKTTVEEVRGKLDVVPGRGQAPLTVKTLDTHLAQTALAPQRVATTILGATAAIGLLLGALGLYGALSDAARQRRRELAIRIALGARRRHIVLLVLRDGARLAGAATLTAMGGSVLLLRFLGRISPSAGAPALWVWLSAPLLLCVAVGVASVLPARRSVSVDPLTVLRPDNE